MRSTKSKNQNMQIPSMQGRAAEVSHPSNLNPLSASETSQDGKRCVRATLHHLSGETSEIMLLVPRYTDWGEYMEDAQRMVREYVFSLTRYWIRITHFKTEIGLLYTDGSFELNFFRYEHSIPLNKVFSIGTDGEWVDPKEHPEYPNFGPDEPGKALGELMKKVNERNEAVYHEVDEITTLCGIPVASKDFYFAPNEKPKSFLSNHRKYLIVYKIINAENQMQEGGCHA